MKPEEIHQMDVQGIAPGRCATCTLERMAEDVERNHPVPERWGESV